MKGPPPGGEGRGEGGIGWSRRKKVVRPGEGGRTAQSRNAPGGASGRGCYPRRGDSRSIGHRTGSVKRGFMGQGVIVYIDGFNPYFGLRSKGWEKAP